MRALRQSVLDRAGDHEASADYATEARICDKLLFDGWEVLDPV